MILCDCLFSKFQDYYIKQESFAVIRLEEMLDKFGDKKDLVLINSGDVPTPMYFAHRKGWINSNEQIKSDLYISNLRLKGLKYIIILKKVFGENLELPYTKMMDNSDFTIYKL